MEENKPMKRAIASILAIPTALWSMQPDMTKPFLEQRDKYVSIYYKSAEFINPKYADAEKKKFKSSARLECLMQDYPKLL